MTGNGGQWAIVCNGNPGCQQSTFALSLVSGPPGLTASFSPSAVAPGAWVQVTLTPSSTTPIGTANVRYQWTVVSGPGPASLDPSNSILVMCGIAVGTCPSARITDLVKQAVVSGDPPPQTQTVVGQQQQLSVSQAPGSGSGTYAMSATSWEMPDNPVQSYDATAGTAPVPLPTPQTEPSTPPFYWTWNGWWNPHQTQTVRVQTKLTRSDNQEIADLTAVAVYDIFTPSGANMDYQIGSGQVGPYIAGDTTPYISFGTVLAPPASEGVRWNFNAVTPPNASGKYAIIQLVTNVSSGVINPSSTGVPPTIPTTNGQEWLDTCRLYGSAVASAAGQLTYVNASTSDNAADAPAILIGDPDPVNSPFSRVTLDMSFHTYFMFRPDGANNIWVTIGKIPWHYSGTAVLGPNGWSPPTNESVTSGPGAATNDFFTYPAVFQPGGTNCPPVPTS